MPRGFTSFSSAIPEIYLSSEGGSDTNLATQTLYMIGQKNIEGIGANPNFSDLSMQVLDANNIVKINKLYLRYPNISTALCKDIKQLLEKNPTINELIIDGFPLARSTFDQEEDGSIASNSEQEIIEFLRLIEEYKIASLTVYLPQLIDAKISGLYKTPSESYLFITALLTEKFSKLQRFYLFNIQSETTICESIEDFYVNNLQITHGKISHSSFPPEAETDKFEYLQTCVECICNANSARILLQDELKKLNLPLMLQTLENINELNPALAAIRWDLYSSQQLKQIQGVCESISNLEIRHAFTQAINNHLIHRTRSLEEELAYCKQSLSAAKEEICGLRDGTIQPKIHWQWYSGSAAKKHAREASTSGDEPACKQQKTY